MMPSVNDRPVVRYSYFRIQFGQVGKIDLILQF